MRGKQHNNNEIHKIQKKQRNETIYPKLKNTRTKIRKANMHKHW